MREATHVAGTLHIILTAQRVNPHAFLAYVTGGHRQVGDADDGGRSLRVFSHTQAVEDGSVTTRGVEASRSANLLSSDPSDCFHGFG